jgi:hypothetical protein
VKQWSTVVPTVKTVAVVEKLVVFPIAGSAALVIGSGHRTVGDGGGEPHTLASGSHLLFMALGDGGPPAVLGLDAPDQGASQGPSGRWAILVGDQFQHVQHGAQPSKYLPMDVV